MKLVLDYAMSFLGTPYKYGGPNRLTGLDCSQLCCEILISCGVLPHGTDLTAQGLYDRFESEGTLGIYQPGTLAFFGAAVNKISHVGFCIDQYRMVECGGGDSHTLTRQDAEAKNAMVRIRPIKYRRDFLVTVKPRYTAIGLI